MSKGCENCVIRQCEAVGPGELPASVMTAILRANDLQPVDGDNLTPEEEKGAKDVLNANICEIKGCKVTLGGLIRWTTPDTEAPDEVSLLNARDTALHELEEAAGTTGCAIFEPQNQRW
jgi:hypothetical protein